MVRQFAQPSLSITVKLLKGFAISKRYLLTHSDGSKEHIDRKMRDDLLARREIVLIGDGRYKSVHREPFIKIPQIGAENCCAPAIVSEFNTQLRQKRIASAPGYHTESKWFGRIELHGWRCYYCDAPLNKQTVTKDHQIAIACGGADWPSNLVPACKSCNSWKGTRSVRVVGKSEVSPSLS